MLQNSCIPVEVWQDHHGLSHYFPPHFPKHPTCPTRWFPVRFLPFKFPGVTSLARLTPPHPQPPQTVLEVFAAPDSRRSKGCSLGGSISPGSAQAPAASVYVYGQRGHAISGQKMTPIGLGNMYMYTYIYNYRYIYIIHIDIWMCFRK